MSSPQGLTSAETGRKWSRSPDGAQTAAGLGRGSPRGGLCLSSARLTGPFESPSAARLALLGGREVLSCSHPGAFPTFVKSPGEVVSAQSSGGAQRSPPRPQTQLSNRRSSTPTQLLLAFGPGSSLSAPAPASRAGRRPRPLLPCRGDTGTTHTHTPPTSPGNACPRRPPLKIGNPVFCLTVD